MSSKSPLVVILLLLWLLRVARPTLDYYQLLGVDRRADAKVISKAFKQVSTKYHPDKDPDNGEVYKAIVNAYEILRNKEKKHEYDVYLN